MKSEIILDKLNKAPNINTNSKEFAIFDWDLQILMIKYSQNSIALMLFNDLTDVYHNERVTYFYDKQTKQKSIEYFTTLKDAILNKTNNIEQIVKYTMVESLKIWESENSV